MYETMMRIRLFEEKTVELIQAGKPLGGVHLYVGEEAVAAGVCANLRDDDYIVSTHRGHGHSIAKGTNVNRMMAELFQKKTGTNKGKGGSMHIAQLSVGNLGANGIVGAGIPIATGAGLSIKLRKTDQVAIAFFGDGATNQGTFNEGLNMASIWKLPVVYVCENNMYAMDVIAVYEATSEAVTRARQGLGPTLIECKTYRYYDHFGIFEISPYAKYERTKEEVDKWKKKDAIKKFRIELTSRGILTSDKVREIEETVKAEIENAVIYAEESADPAPKDALEDLFVS
jgi:TPP-dependent pyruvate/acetoin dehydrogenase alpha subunit